MKLTLVEVAAAIFALTAYKNKAKRDGDLLAHGHVVAIDRVLRELRDEADLLTAPPIVIDPANTLQRIDRVWMVISSDEQGEGVCAGPLPGSGVALVPLIAADEARLPFIRDMGKLVARTTGKKVKLIRLDVRTDVEDL